MSLDRRWCLVHVTSEIVETMSLLLLLFPVVRELPFTVCLGGDSIGLPLLFSPLYVGSEISPSLWLFKNALAIALARAIASSKPLGRSNLLGHYISDVMPNEPCCCTFLRSMVAILNCVNILSNVGFFPQPFYICIGVEF